MEQKVKQDICIGTNVRKLRENSHRSQRDITSTMQLLGCNISRESYAKIEAGLLNIRVTELEALRTIYNLADFNPFFEDLHNLPKKSVILKAGANQKADKPSS